MARQLDDGKVALADGPLDVVKAHAHGLAILMSTHTLEVAEEVCDTVGILHHGRLVVQGPPDVLRKKQGLEGEKEANLESLFLLLTNPENANQSEALPLSEAT